MADKVKVLDSVPVSTTPSYNPLTGEELRLALEKGFHEALVAEHGLFSLARCWPRTKWTVVVELDCVGQNLERVVAVGDSEPPDKVRQELGRPIERRDAKPAEPQFSEEAPTEGDKTPIKVTRRASQ